MVDSATGLVNVLVLLAFLIIKSEVGRDTVFNRQVPDGEYDFIVIGGGTAGCVVAAKLSEHPRAKVLLLEAGEEDSLITDMPAMSGVVMSSPDLVWRFTTTDQNEAFHGYHQQRTTILQGKVIGGSSTINGMAYVRALPEDIRNWADLQVTGWSWQELFRYYLKSEHNTDYSLGKDFHNYDGEFFVSSPEDVSDLNDALVQASLEMGYRKIDFNANETVGVGIQQVTVKDGERWTSSKAYLWPARQRRNLHVIKQAYVQKIMFDEKLDATAVIVTIKEKRYIVRKRREIIVCAGAINTPKLLMLSGIGPRDHLEQLNITCLVDLPVGNNFHDNPLTSGVHFTVNLTRSTAEILTWQNIYEFLRVGKGPLAKADKALLRARTKYGSEEWPDISIFVGLGSLADSKSYPVSSGIKRDIWESVYKPYSNITTMSMTPMVNRPISRGTVRLSSSNFEDPPLVDPGYLKEEKDLNVLVEGMKLCYEVALMAPFAKLNAVKFATVFPNCKEQFENSTVPPDSYLKCVAKTMTFTYAHPAGTCRMGNSNDSVITPELHVKGVTSLRVVDSSVVPQSPSGSLYSTVVAVAEKASRIIIKKHIQELY